MKKNLKVFFIIFIILGFMAQISLLTAQNENSSGNSAMISADNNSSDNISNDEKICCYIFGYGANMEKVNSQYELMNQNECETPKNFVGGGREITSKIKCQKGYANQIKEAVQERNRLRFHEGNWDGELPENCTGQGSTIKCDTDNGKVMAVMAGNSGNTIIQVQGINASTQAELYHSNGKLYAISENNETILIEFLPDEIREKIRNRISAKISNESIEINEKGEYEIQIRKKSRLLGFIPIEEKVELKFNAENGELLKEKKSWWGFLSVDVNEK